MKTFLCILALLVSRVEMSAQTDIENLLKYGQLILGGVTIVKSAEAEKTDNPMVSVCVKNRLSQKVTFILKPSETLKSQSSKEMVIQNLDKECFISLQKGVYTYEVLLPNKELYRKGDCLVEEDLTITLKD